LAAIFLVSLPKKSSTPKTCPFSTYAMLLSTSSLSLFFIMIDSSILPLSRIKRFSEHSPCWNKLSKKILNYYYFFIFSTYFKDNFSWSKAWFSHSKSYIIDCVAREVNVKELNFPDYPPIDINLDLFPNRFRNQL